MRFVYILDQYIHAIASQPTEQGALYLGSVQSKTVSTFVKLLEMTQVSQSSTQVLVKISRGDGIHIMLPLSMKIMTTIQH